MKKDKKKSKEQFGFICECDYCKYELDSMKNPEEKKKSVKI